ncbi:hypothetical protein GF325_14290 [Candidatus Bathyarchaeota archaeon]|nr:hypothetical protein [Candidatus Bathyarchaeota archaeon]
MNYTPDTKQLVTSAEDLLASNELDGAILNYKKAANQLMEKGSYIEVFLIYKQIIDILKKQAKFGEAITTILGVAKKLVDLNIQEEAAKFYKFAGNVSYEVQDYLNASEYYEKASDLFLEVSKRDDNPDMRKLSGILLIKSSESLSRVHNKKEKSETLILRGIYLYSGLKSKIPELESKLTEHLKSNKFETSLKIAGELTQIMDEVISDLKVVDDFPVEHLQDMVRVRLEHYSSEYTFLAYLVNRQLPLGTDNPKYGKKANQKLERIIERLKGLMALDHDKEDVDRYCFDGMLLAIYNDLEDNSKNDALVQSFTESFQVDLIRQVEENQYFKAMVRIQKYGLELAKQAIRELSLGKFSRIKSLFMKLLFA